jgi:hypothetical protein
MISGEAERTKNLYVERGVLESERVCLGAWGEGGANLK